MLRGVGPAGTQAKLSREKGVAPGGAALLTIPVREQRGFFSYTINVRRLVTHHTAIVTTWVKPADIIAYDGQPMVKLGREFLLKKRDTP